MITKVYSNVSNINFQSNVNLGSGADDILDRHLNLWQSIKFKYQMYKLKNNNQDNDVFIKGSCDKNGDGIVLSVKQKGELLGESSFNFGLNKSAKFSLANMYNKACKPN